MVKELTIDQVRANAANFMYIFAPDAFLKAIPSKYAKIIRMKAANQKLLLQRSAEKYGSTLSAMESAAREGFIAQYGVTPIDALVTLANGGSVAGKNWKEGVFGIGALSNKFSGATVNDQEVTVNSSNGHIYVGNTDITDESKTVYQNIGDSAVAYQLFSKDDVLTFMSQYNKTTGKYYAQSYVDANGTKHNASGSTISNSESGSVWENIIFSIQTFIDWLLSLFGYNSSNTLNEENTLPNQKTDGFVYESGFGEAGAILLALAAGGALLALGGKGKKGKKTKM